MKAKTATPSPAQVRENVYTRLREEILACALPPGARIHEQDLVSRYHVGKPPIRDALLRLQEQGLVDALPRSGYRIRPISLADALELYEMRQVLERECVARAVEAARDSELAQLDHYRKVARNIDLGAWIAYNREFHGAIAAASHNSRLARAAADVVEEFDRLTYVSINAAGDARSLQRSVDEHGALIDAIQHRDKRRALVLLREHIESSRKRTLASISNPPIVP